jgi:MoxR-like ATPase
MRSRHQVDTSLRFSAADRQPDTKEVDDPGCGPVAASRTVSVVREPYLASPGLQDAVNLAIALGRPLLLQGDPGTGKTQLAHAVAYALGLPLDEAYVKSTSRAQDLLYTYDAVGRLYDAQLPPEPPRPAGAGESPPASRLDVGRPDVNRSAARRPDPRRAGDYIRLGPLGRSIARTRHGRRSVVLIDEIDKADIDFPNDLLHELDQLAFDVPEVPGLRYGVPRDRPDLRPIVIVTNNEEKTLPAAFLRRCVFHYIEFPQDARTLDDILALHEITDVPLRGEAVDLLLQLRALDLSKKPGLSELLDWAGYLQAMQTPPEDVGDLPYLGALLKQRGDQLRAQENLARK